MTTLPKHQYPTSSLITTDEAGIQRHDHQQAEWGLQRYALQIAAGLELGRESVYCEVDSHAVVYIALAGNVPHLPRLDTALVWNSHNGWAIGVEYPNGLHVLVLEYLGAVLFPEPSAVVRFANAALAGRNTGQLLPPRPSCPDLMRRLAEHNAQR